MSLSKTLADIKRLTPIANTDPDQSNPSTYRSLVGQKRQAEEQLIGLKEDYAAQILGTAAFILVNGDAKDEFASIATYENFRCFSADPEALYKDLASRVDPGLYLNRASTSDAFDVLTRHLEDLAVELGLFSYPALQFRQEYSRACANTEEFTAIVKKAINDQVGSELVGVYTAQKIAPDAIAANHSGEITPIILASSDTNLIADLVTNLSRIPSKAFVVTAGKSKGKKIPGAISVKEPNQESVLEALTTIRGGL